VPLEEVKIGTALCRRAARTLETLRHKLELSLGLVKHSQVEKNLHDAPGGSSGMPFIDVGGQSGKWPDS